MILEGLLSTTNPDGSPHLSAMGPSLEAASVLILRPFRGSTTFANLLRDQQAVFHVIDDALLLARVVTGVPGKHEFRPASKITGHILTCTCRAYELEIRERDVSAERARMVGTIVKAHELRGFLGWNRARHAVLEAAIHATRVGMIDPERIRAELALWRPLVEKTGGPDENEAWRLLESYIESRLAEAGGRR
jgi:hypothetical protein